MLQTNCNSLSGKNGQQSARLNGEMMKVGRLASVISPFMSRMGAGDRLTLTPQHQQQHHQQQHQQEQNMNSIV